MPELPLDVYKVAFSFDYRDPSGKKLGKGPAAGVYVYADVPGDDVVDVQNRWKTNSRGIAGWLLPKTSYNFYHSYGAERLEKSWLASELEEDDCQKVDTGTPQKGVLNVVLRCPVQRIKLGEAYTQRLEHGAVGRVYIPSKRGGRLTVSSTTADAGLALFHPDLVTAYKGHSERDERALTSGRRKLIKAEGGLQAWLKPGEHGWFTIKTSKSTELSVRYYEEAVPRDKDKTPFFPYHFYYWPVNQKEPWNGQNTVLRKYARAFGLDEDEVCWWEIGGEDAIWDGGEEGHDEVVRLADEETKYEQEGLGHYRPSDADWAGHCHNAAPASIFFKEPPKGGLKHNGVQFSQSELEFLQTEFAGNFCDIAGDGWVLPSVPADLKIRWRDGSKKGVNRPGTPLNLLLLFKPSDPKPAETLESVLFEKYHHEKGDYEQFDSKNAREEAARIIKAHGGAAGFNATLQKRWFEVGLSFLEATSELMGSKGHPLLGDIRSNSSDDGPAAIWNNGLMYMRMHYAEREAGENERDIAAVVEYHFNIDNFDAIGDPTCKITAGEIVPVNYWGRRQRLELRYKTDGSIDKKHPENRFPSFQFFMGPSDDGELYMVAYLSRMKTPVAGTRMDRDDFDGGNPYIDYNPIFAKLIELRDKYNNVR